MEQLDQVKVVEWGRERQLVAYARFAPGDVIASETPLVSAPLAPGQDNVNPWDLVLLLLQSPGLLDAYWACTPQVTQFFMLPDDLEIERSLAKRYAKARPVIRTLYYGLGTNNMAFYDREGKIAGWAFFATLSKANHSCRPNAEVRAGDPHTRQVQFVATQEIAPNEPITWNYSGNPAFLRADYLTRNLSMYNVMRFVCRCPRCRDEQPPEIAKYRRPENYFNTMLAAAARRA